MMEEDEDGDDGRSSLNNSTNSLAKSTNNLAASGDQLNIGLPEEDSFSEDLRELKYQYHSPPLRIFFVHIWPRLNYFWLHLCYILTVSVLGGCMIYGIEKDNPAYGGDRPHLTLIDAILSSTSATSGCSLAVLDFWVLHPGSQVVHMIVAQLGGIVFVGAMTALIRRRSLTVWLNKHPQRKYRDADNLVLCHSALLRLAIALLAFEAVTITVGWILLTIYSNTTLRDSMETYNTNPTWFALFTIMCAFNQAGFALTEDGLIPFNNHFFFALVLTVVILISNMLLPVVIRGIISVVAKWAKKPDPWTFLLDHPRICSTIMFPAAQTRVLSGFVAGFFFLQVFTFAILDYTYPVMDYMTGWQQFVLSFFQAANTMQTGFPVLDVAETNIAQQWCYFIYMLVAIYPYVSMLRNTEVVAEGHDFFHPDSLIKQSERESAFGRRMTEGTSVDKAGVVWNHSVHHLKRTFLGDAFWLLFAIFLICVTDGKAIENDTEFSMWKVIFEVASAYGCVGLSLGYPSWSGFGQIFSQGAKVVLVGVLILGRHREMPRNRDVAVMQVEMLAKHSR